MAVTVYRWDDGSAPTLSAANGALITVLDAVLVNGYGAKSAAGWTKSFSGTNKAAYRQGTGSTQFYLRVDNSTSNNFPRLRGYETMSDVDTGTNPYPTEAQVAGGLYGHTSSSTDSTARPWVIVADAKRFYMWIGYSLTTGTGLGSTAYMPVFFFGDITSHRSGDAYHSMIIAYNGASSSNGNFSAIAGNFSAQAGHYIARSNDQTTLSLNNGKLSDVRGPQSTSTSVMGATASATYPDPVTGGLLLAPVYVTEPTTKLTRGVMPGLWHPLHNLPGSPGDTFSGTSAGGLSGKTFLLLDAGLGSTRGRIALETSDTW